jgi:hypothetical protein
MNRKNPCECKKTVIYKKKKCNPYVITGQHEIPEWIIKLKKRNLEMFGNI